MREDRVLISARTCQNKAREQADQLENYCIAYGVKENAGQTALVSITGGSNP